METPAGPLATNGGSVVVLTRPYESKTAWFTFRKGGTDTREEVRPIQVTVVAVDLISPPI